MLNIYSYLKPIGQLHDMYFIFHLRNKLINDKIFCSLSFTFFEYFEGKYKKNPASIVDPYGS